jgi:hypothetical protein
MRDWLLRVLRSVPGRIVAAFTFLLFAIIVRELLLGLIRAATGLRRTPPLWLSPHAEFAVRPAGIAYAFGGAALGSTALIFGALHAANRGATGWSTIAVALSGGLVLGAAFILTRRLWLPIGIHFAVNATQGALPRRPCVRAQGAGVAPFGPRR